MLDSESIGKTLKDARTKKGLSIEQVAQFTRIKIRFLEALENDQFDQLSSQVQTKGFLRMYADLVGIPLQPLLDRLYGKPEPPESAAEEPLQPSPVRIPHILLDNKAVNKLSDLLKLRPPLAAPPQIKEPLVSATPVQIDAVSVQIFKEIGGLIFSRRETLGLSLQDIEEFIHIRDYYLKLIEEGKFLELPSMVQARGMLNNYLNFLDLDAENIMLRYADALQALYGEKTGAAAVNKTKTTRNEKKTPKTQYTGWRRFLTTDLIFGSSVILAILVFSIWGAVQIASTPNRPNQPNTGSISEALIESTSIATGTVTAVNNVKMNPEGVQSALQNTNEAQPQSQVTSTLVFTGNGPLQLYIVSHQRTWMRITVDGKKVFEGRVLPGNAYPYSGNQQIELLTGNAGALVVSYLQNGAQNDMGTLGTTGEVKSLIFTNQGVYTPTPHLTPSATITIQPSVTPQPSATEIKPTVTPYIP